uniref:CheR family methyltransferase n=1 Tax=Mangrovicoccus ximenensis TaxID=1911570 RepID=UPI002ED15410
GKVLRNMVRFSYQSLIKDPPFSKLDLISCRNLTIYFEPKLQKVAASVFHYALTPGGFLMLGLSENPTGVTERFEEFDHSVRIFRRDNQMARPLDLPLGRLSHGLPRLGSEMTPPLTGGSPRAQVERAILRREYLRARLTPEGQAEVFGSEGSGRISGLSWADGLVELPDGAAEVTPGTPVRYLPYASFGLG